MTIIDELVASLEGSFSDTELSQIAKTLAQDYGKLAGPSKLLDVLTERVLKIPDLTAALDQQVRR